MLFQHTELLKAKDSQLSAFYKIDPFDIDFSEKQYEEYTDQELVAARGDTLVFDVESYINYFIVTFKSVTSGKIVCFEASADCQIDYRKLAWVMQNFLIVGFNSAFYDVPILSIAFEFPYPAVLKGATSEIIIGEQRGRAIEQKYGIKIPPFPINHIDLISVAPLMASLKAYGGRIHTARMQELPLAHNAVLTQHEARCVKHYNINDLDITIDLYNELKPAIELRSQMSQEYGVDVRSKSDAQIAESVISTDIKKIKGYLPKVPRVNPGTTFKYKVPDWLRYNSPEFNKVLEIVKSAEFVVNEHGNVDMPPQLGDLRVRFKENVYRLGIGGLHSSEKCVSHKSDDDTLLIDKDVASYYPAIILSLGLYPKHLGPTFLQVYQGIVNRRLQAKRDGNKVVNESLKITINGSFGKTGNKYSILYSPDLLIQITVTGQLALLMLIERIEYVGACVVSANTDGVTFTCAKDRYNYVQAEVISWEKVTGFTTEETRYRAIYHRDINNYIAIDSDGKAKVKGAYAEVGSSGKSRLSKNPEANICNDALIAFLSKGTPVSDTIRTCNDVRRFITVRHVTGGAEKSGTYLGREIRWYYSKTMKGAIHYVKNGNTVPATENAMPCMDLPTSIPSDLDYDYYIANVKESLKEIGYYGKRYAAAGTLL